MPTTRSITIATAGHVDHGKTTLVNRITGVDTDTLAEEKSRGLSINLGFAYHHLPPNGADNPLDLTIGFVDVPGHTDFINNALAGISVVDSALLIIAADDGVMPQTREHLAIVDLLNINNGAIVLTKIDKVSPERIIEVQKEISSLVSGTCMEKAPVFPASSVSGQGIDDVIDYLRTQLLQLQSPSENLKRNFRFIIDRSFTVTGIGTVLTGTVKSGVVRPGDNLAHSATAEAVRVKGLRHDQQLVDEAIAGERVAINVNIPHQQIRRGDWLLDAQLNHPVTRLDVKLRLLQDTTFKASSFYHLYHGAAHRLVKIRPLEKENGEFYQITSQEPLWALFGDRFILRDPASANTIGGGKVIDIFVPRRGRSNPQRLTTLKRLDQSDFDALRTLMELQDSGVSLNKFAIGRNCSPAEIDDLLTRLTGQQIPFEKLSIKSTGQTLLLHADYYQRYCTEILGSLATYHKQFGNQLGISEPALSKLVSFKNSHLLFHAILEQLVANKRIDLTGTLLHLPGHEVRLSVEEEAFMNTIRPVLMKSGFLPPRTRELTEITGMNLLTLERTLGQARKAGSLIQVAANRHYLPETIMQLAEFTETLAQQQDSGFSVIQFRDEIGIGRNLCIEVLEYFDKVGFTRRDGNSRYLRTPKENLFGSTS